MAAFPPLAALASAALLISCSGEAPKKAETTPEKSDAKQKEPIVNETDTKVLFEDAMVADWQKNWFLDGKNATLEHRDGGLYFAAGTITKAMDREKYHAHHAVLWTKREFEGDIAISFEMKRVDASTYGTTLVYIQAQGIGAPPYVEDIHAWRELRDVPAMSHYFNYMNLLSLSLRGEIRFKRYPWNDVARGTKYKTVLVEPMHEYDGIESGKTYRVEIEKRNPSLTIRLYDPHTGARFSECTWDASKGMEDRPVRFIEKGRIGLRHMSTRQHVYRNFKVSRL